MINGFWGSGFWGLVEFFFTGVDGVAFTIRYAGFGMIIYTLGLGMNFGSFLPLDGVTSDFFFF